MRALRLSVAAAMLVSVAGCATPEKTSTGKENEVATSEMKPDEALAALKKASRELMAGIAPGVEFTEAGTNRAVPCGGPGGSEYSKVHLDFEGGLSAPASDPRVPQGEELFSKAESTLRRMGLEVRGRQRTPAGDGLVFAGDGFGGRIILHVQDAVMVRGQTACLDNPDDLR
ncbi:hypothetical protein [Nocardioides daphniae]|uniref:DUF3558 domain-containing protein n=1 Tax=Nocardioides daphniae TaxID=402297 RepID=A0A4P7UDJ7_9ACTN|nr:hypothetical protein [Nocardioides daphniae]QCC77924.1 hypothetical protein E2C04_13360 [Nocardioides daphniae]GGD23984.1 hypothetical protein GCM10007231_23900 [Nocardioides daphniae]